MKLILKCRRTSIAVLAIGCLFILGLRGASVSESIAAVAMGLAAANAGEAVGRKKGASDDKPTTT